MSLLNICGVFKYLDSIHNIQNNPIFFMLELLIIFWVWYFFYYKSHKNNIPTSLQEQLDNSSAIINAKIRDIDISNISEVFLVPNNHNIIHLKTKNFYKIVKAIIDETHKYYFEPNELRRLYEYVLQNYETSLSKDEYASMKDILDVFVENGWKVEITYGVSPFYENATLPQSSWQWWGLLNGMSSFLKFMFMTFVVWPLLFCWGVILLYIIF